MTSEQCWVTSQTHTLHCISDFTWERIRRFFATFTFWQNGYL